MKTTVKLKFRPSTVEGKTGSLYVQFIKDRKTRLVVFKECKIYPHEWDEERESFRVNTGSPERKAYMEKLYERMKRGKEQLLDVIGKLESRFEDYTVDDVIREYEQYRSRNNLAAYAEQLASRVEEHKPRTARTYRSVIKKVDEFYGHEIRMDKIDSAFVKQFEADILAQGRKKNTSSYYLRSLRAILNHAVEDKVIEFSRERLFAGVFTGNEKTEKRAVKQEVIETMETIDFQATGNKRLELACRAFLLSYYLRGISFIDLAYLKKENIRDGCIFYTRRKTGQKFEIEITPEIQDILDYYRVEDNDYLLPFLRRGDSHSDYANALRRENGCLKELSVLIGLDKPLTTYVARHSWASNAYAMGVSIDLISQGLGHENIRTTMIYLKSFDYSHLHEANRKVICGGKKTENAA